MIKFSNRVFKGSFFLIFWLLVLTGQSQSILDTDREALLLQSRIESERWTQRRAVAEEWAKNAGRPVRMELDNGRVLELQFIDTLGMPAYYITHNIDAAASIGTLDLRPGGALGLNLTGTGMTIRQWDAGRPRPTHVELTGRLTAGDGTSSNQQHSTHVAGTLIASGVRSPAQGMAPAASLRYFDWNNDLSEMTSEAANGALISNHSYGYGRGWTWTGSNWTWSGNNGISATEDYLFGFYDAETRSWDQLAYNRPYYLIFKSAGNDRGEGPGTSPPNDGPYDCIGSDAIGKNVITIGAVEDLGLGYQGTSSVVMTSFSSWGPADDGRIKPDVCANGSDLYSANSTGNTAYVSLSGTSMASPSAAGSALLLQQYHQQLKGSGQFMRAATLKALIIHTADEAGPDPGPDYMFGWGLMNTAAAAKKLTEDLSFNVIDELTLSNGATYTRQIKSSGSQSIRVTIVWTDPPGTPVAPALDPTNPALVNDLDLRITNQYGQTFYPWRLNPASPANPALRNGENNVDNVEMVDIEMPLPGVYTITVDHDGTLSGGSQAFSIIISGEEAFIDPPQAFSAVVNSQNPTSSILLSWTKNNSGNGVVIAWNNSPEFGHLVDGKAYGYGDPVPNGGMVIYSGIDTVLLHPDLSSGTRHYYRIWSYDASHHYSYAIFDDDSTTGSTEDAPTALTANVSACGIIDLAWVAPGPPPTYFFDDFESYTDFSLSCNPWTQYDVDGYSTYKASAFDFPNQYYIGSYIVFNPSQTTPPNASGWESYGGSKYLACFAATSFPNNDWLITPQLSITSGIELSFYARSITSQYGLERFVVLVSTTGNAIGDFTKISAGTYVQAPVAWTEYTYDLSAYAGQDIYIAIRCVSHDAFVFMLDNFYVGASKAGNKGMLTATMPDPMTVTGLSEQKEVGVWQGNTVVDTVMGSWKSGIGGKSLDGYYIYRDGYLYDSTLAGQISYQDNQAGYSPRDYYVVAKYASPYRVSSPSNIAYANAASAGKSPVTVFSEAFSVNTANPSGWSTYFASTANLASNTTRFVSGPRSIRFNRSTSASRDSWLISPAIDLRDVTSATLRYSENVDYASTTSAQGNRVRVSEDYVPGNNAYNYKWVTIHNLVGPEDAWQEITVDLSPYIGKVIYIAFHYTGYASCTWYLDDFKVETSQKCYKYWVGAADSNWNNSANWSSLSVPGALDEILIPAGCVAYPSFNSATDAGLVSVDIERGARLILQPNERMTLTGGLTNRGSLLLQANASSAASLIDAGRITGSGAYAVEQYIGQNQWHYLTPKTSPSYSGLFTGMYMLQHDEASGGWGNYVTATDLFLEPGKGFAIWSASTVPKTGISYLGRLHTGVINIKGLSRTSSIADSLEGFNLVGNPYPSAINWQSAQGISRTHVNNAIYYWAPSLNGGAGTYAYFVDGVGVPNGVATGIIPSGQGFLVRVADGFTSGQLSFDNRARVHQNSGFFKGDTMTDPILRIMLAFQGHTDEAAIRFREMASTGFDAAFDAIKLFQNNQTMPLVYILASSGEDLSIQSLPPLSSAVSVPLGVRNNVTGNYTLRFPGLQDFMPGVKVVLEDLLLDSLQDLRQNIEYEYPVAVAWQGQRFLLHFLPVEVVASVYYANTQKTPLVDIPVFLESNGLSVGDTAISDAKGEVRFLNVPNGNYILVSQAVHPWGGVNATDALKVAQHFTTHTGLDSLQVLAADVDASGYVNTADALMIQMRFVDLISTFPSGDWLFSKPGLTINEGLSYHLEIPALCFGDLDASYVVPAKEMPLLERRGAIQVEGKRFSMILSSLDEVSLASLSLVLGIPDGPFKVLDCEMADGTPLVWNLYDNQLKMAWYSLKPWHLKPGDALIVIHMELTSNALPSASTAFSILPGSLATGVNGQPIAGFSLGIPAWISFRHETPLSLYPNPLRGDQLNLAFLLDEPSSVRLELLDPTGRLIQSFSRLQYVAGEHLLTIRLENLAAGMYWVRFLLQSDTKTELITRKLIIQRP